MRRAEESEGLGTEGDPDFKKKLFFFFSRDDLYSSTFGTSVWNLIVDDLDKEIRKILKGRLKKVYHCSYNEPEIGNGRWTEVERGVRNWGPLSEETRRRWEGEMYQAKGAMMWRTVIDMNELGKCLENIEGISYVLHRDSKHECAWSTGGRIWGFTQTREMYGIE